MYSATASASFIPKHSFYSPDGTGRDTYITLDSGGLLHDIQRSSLPILGSTVKQAISPTKTFKPRLDAKPFHYYSDGSGRDHYITINEGGLCVQQPGMKAGLWNSLRHYDKIRTGPEDRKDYFEWAQKRPSRRKFFMEKAKSIQVKDVVGRLTLPKLSGQEIGSKGNNIKLRSAQSLNPKCQNNLHTSSVPCLKAPYGEPIEGNLDYQNYENAE